MPSSTRRKTFMMSRLPNRIDELLCSALPRCGVSGVSAGLAAGPAAGGAVVGQHGLEFLVAGRTEQFGPVARQSDRGHDVLLVNDFLAAAANSRRDGQREPVEAVGTDRQQVRRFADRR